MPRLSASRAASLLGVACLLSSCATEEPPKREAFQRVLSFGDSLSDVGTYEPAARSFGGGRFTTNPGAIWVEVVADHLGLSITPNRTEGFELPTTLLGGTGYAQGGARVKLRPGVGCNPDPQTGRCLFVSAVPVSEQVSRHLETGAFEERDLVFVLGGNNDVFFQRGEVAAGRTTAPDAVEAMRQAARDQVAELSRIEAAGARHVVTFTVPDSSGAPSGASLSPTQKELVTSLVAAFNETLIATLEESGLETRVLDVHALFGDFIVHPEAHGLANVTEPACLPRGMLGNTSLFCAPDSLVTPDADETHLFADDTHPSTKGHALFADFVLEGLRGFGWL